MNSYIDMRTLVDKNNNVNRSTGEYIFDSSIEYAKSCTISDERRWPSPAQMMLDVNYL